MIHFVAELPRNATGKVQRTVLATTIDNSADKSDYYNCLPKRSEEPEVTYLRLLGAGRERHPSDELTVESQRR